MCGKGRRTHFRKAALDPRGTLAACPRSVAIAVYSGVGGALSPRYPGTFISVLSCRGGQRWGARHLNRKQLFFPSDSLVVNTRPRLPTVFEVIYKFYIETYKMVEKIYVTYNDVSFRRHFAATLRPARLRRSWREKHMHWTVADMYRLPTA